MDRQKLPSSLFVEFRQYPLNLLNDTWTISLMVLVIEMFICSFRINVMVPNSQLEMEL